MPRPIRDLNGSSDTLIPGQILRIKDFSAGYSQEEDRLLLEVACDEDHQLYWLTRRALSTLSEAINRTLSAQYALMGEQLGARDHAADFAQFGHLDATEKLGIASSGGDQEKLADNALLVYEVGYQVLDQERAILKLANRQGEGFQYQLVREVLHAILNLLASQAGKAGWELHFPLVTQSALPDTGGAERHRTIY